MDQATAIAHPNVELIRYWGNADEALHIPSNSSISMNLAGLETSVTVSWSFKNSRDMVTVDGEEPPVSLYRRIVTHLDHIRRLVGKSLRAKVVARSNFPPAMGVNMNASLFAALTLAAVRAAGLELSERELTSLARLGEGAACRSIPSGFVIWHRGDSHETSFAESIAGPEHWPLVDLITVVSLVKHNGTQANGHMLAATSDLQAGRIISAPGRLAECKEAILDRDFRRFAEVVEMDTTMMHAVMMTSRPQVFYWAPITLSIIDRVRAWRDAGLNVCFSIEAGPNVHCICEARDADQIEAQLSSMGGVLEVRKATPGGPARLI